MSLSSRLIGAVRAVKGQAANPRSLAEHGTTAVNLIQTPDIGRKLVTRFGIREKAPAPTLAAEVVPVVVVDDLVGESDLIAPRIKPCSGGAHVTAAFLGATPEGVGLWNPPGSRSVVHAYYFTIQASSVCIMGIHVVGATALPAGWFALPTQNNGFRNTLFPGQKPGAFTVAGAGAGAAIGGDIHCCLRVPTNTAMCLPFDMVLNEGTGIFMWQEIGVAADLSFGIFWSEEAKH